MVGGQPVKLLLGKNNPHDKVPVVVLTSSNQEPDLHRAHELGGNSFSVKAGDFEESTDAVQQLDSSWLLLNQAPQQ